MEVHQQVLALLNGRANLSKCASEFPLDFLDQEQRVQGGLLLHFIIVLYACIGLAIVVEIYFIPSLEIIIERMNIQDDVGGATFLTIGSSLPDLVASIIAVLFGNQNSLGIGTVSGTSSFNVLLVLGVCGIFAGESVKISWWPFIRDMSVYCISLITLMIMVSDKYVSLTEALIMVILYGLYLILLSQNPTVEKQIYNLINDEETFKYRFESEKYSRLDVVETKDDDDSSETSSQYDCCDYPTDPPENPFLLPGPDFLEILFWIITLPLKILFFVSIPDLKKKKCKKLFIVTFFVCIIWIGIFCYIVMWMVTTIGQTLHISSAIMGVTFVTIGNSVPDLYCSIVAMRRGKPDMAMSQAIAANPLGIFIGLGLPWLIRTASTTEDIHIDLDGTLISSGMALGFAVPVIVFFYCRKFHLTKTLGITLIIGYVIFLVCDVVTHAVLDKVNCAP